MPDDAMADTIKAFFDSYRSAFESFDATALERYFAFPCHITSDSDEIVLTSLTKADDYIRLIDRFLQSYRAAGVAAGAILDLTIVALTPRLAQCRIHWDIQNADKQTLYDFRAVYTLANIDSAWRIVAIVHDELPHLNSLLRK